MPHQKNHPEADPSHQEHVMLSTALFRTLIENSPDITLLFAVNGNIAYASSAAKAIIGYATSDLISRSLFSLVHPHDLANLEHILTDITQTARTMQSIECRLSCQDGSWRWFAGTLTNLQHRPEVAALAGTFRDITERKQQEEQLHQEQQHEHLDQQGQVLDAVLSSIPDFAYIFDVSGRFTYVNRALLDLLQRTKEQVIHKNFHDLEYPFDLATRLQRQIQEVITTGTILKDETPFTNPAGHQGYYEYIFVPIFAQDGTVSEVAGSTRDISERHREEEERQLLLEREQATNELLHFVADFMPQKVWTADAQGHFTYFNHRWIEYTGLSIEHLSQNWEQASAPNEQEAQRRQWQLSLTTGQTFEYEHLLRHVDGTYRWHLSRALAQKNADGQILMWIGTSTDIDEQKKLDEQKDTFISMASHELRTPLTTIKAALQIAERRARLVLQKNQPESEEMSQAILNISTMLDRALRQVSIQTRLIKDLLDGTRIQQNKLSLLLEPCDINSIVCEVIDDQHTLTPTRTILLQELPQEPLLALVDRERIGQVLANYLSNALKYSPATQPITVGIIRIGLQARVWVQDNGQGLSEEQQKQIWERFYQVQDIQVQSGSSVGLGLGLHICKTLIEQHKGQVGVDSKPGAGSTFWFTLPLIEKE